MTIEEQLTILIDKISENNNLLILIHEMLKSNNEETDWLYNKMKVLLSPELEWRNFGINVMADLAGNLLINK